MSKRPIPYYLYVCLLFFLPWPGAYAQKNSDARQELSAVMAAYREQRPFRCSASYTYLSDGQVTDSLAGELYLQDDGYYLQTRSFTIVAAAPWRLMVDHTHRRIQCGKAQPGHEGGADWLDPALLDQLITSGTYTITQCIAATGQPYIQLSARDNSQDVQLYYDAREYLIRQIQVRIPMTDLDENHIPRLVYETLLIDYKGYVSIKANERKRLEDYVQPTGTGLRTGRRTEGYTIIQ